MIILLDNGSKRADAVLNLRRIGEEVQQQIGQPVEAVSLQHVDGIDPSFLDGRPALSLQPFLRQHLQTQAAATPLKLRIVPLFFGPSRAISSMLPQVLSDVEAEFGPLEIRVAPPLCPLPEGESRLVDILEAHVRGALPSDTQTDPTDDAPPQSQVLVVDHGSPVPQVTAVREWLTQQLATRLKDVPVGQAVMERRSGAEYDFNGALLEERLEQIAEASQGQPVRVVLAMQFISPGRHAGDGGDIAEIAEAVCKRHDHLEVLPSPLIGAHPLFTELLAERIRGINAD